MNNIDIPAFDNKVITLINCSENLNQLLKNIDNIEYPEELDHFIFKLIIIFLLSEEALIEYDIGYLVENDDLQILYIQGIKFPFNEPAKLIYSYNQLVSLLPEDGVPRLALNSVNIRTQKTKSSTTGPGTRYVLNKESNFEQLKKDFFDQYFSDKEKLLQSIEDKYNANYKETNILIGMAN